MYYMFTLVTIMNITIREVNSRLWRELKSESAKEGLTMGEALNLALETFLEEKKSKKHNKNAKSFLDLKPYAFKGEGQGSLSSDVDSVLYGWKK